MDVDITRLPADAIVTMKCQAVGAADEHMRLIRTGCDRGYITWLEQGRGWPQQRLTRMRVRAQTRRTVDISISAAWSGFGIELLTG